MGAIRLEIAGCDVDAHRPCIHKSAVSRGLATAVPGYDFKSPRLYVDAPLAAGANVALERPQAHYLTHVLRLKAGEPVLVFNGRDGEWSASLAESGKRSAALAVAAQTRPQTTPADLHYLFAPLKSA